MRHFLLVALSTIIGFAVSEVVNTEVQRTIDASTPFVKITIDIKVSGVQGEYKLAFPDYQAKQLAYLHVTKKGKVLSVTAPVTANNITYFSVEPGEGSPNIKVVAVFTDLLTPYPAEIGQHDNQLVLYSDNHFFTSPYSTQSQKTTVKLASSQIESYTKLDPTNARGSSIVFGPYKDIEPLEESPLTVHYVNNKPFSKFTTLQREIEVSHWGNIFVEELIELKHVGAKLREGLFSRFEYMMRRQQDSPAFRNLRALLPIQANSIYYRDQIGNISTSDMRFFDTDGQIELQIETRFPIYGGWQTQFYLGYALPTEVGLFNAEDGRYNFKFDWFTVFEDVWIEDLEVKVVLPEGATDIKVDVPYTVEQSWTRRFTFLDTTLNGGRPVLTLKAKKVVPEHNEKVTISYTFDKSRMLVEPLLVIGSFFLVFVMCSLLVRLDAAKAVVVGEKSDFHVD